MWLSSVQNTTMNLTLLPNQWCPIHLRSSASEQILTPHWARLTFLLKHPVEGIPVREQAELNMISRSWNTSSALPWGAEGKGNALYTWWPHIYSHFSSQKFKSLNSSLIYMRRKACTAAIIPSDTINVISIFINLPFNKITIQNVWGTFSYRPYIFWTAVNIKVQSK